MACLQSVLDGLEDAIETKGASAYPEDISSLERLAAEAIRTDAAATLTGVFTALGKITPHGVPDGYRKITVCTRFGYVSFPCAYYGSDLENETRQMRRLRERKRAAGEERQKKNGAFIRTGGASSPYPLKVALGVADGMTRELGASAQYAGVFGGSFGGGSAMLGRFLGFTIPTSTFRRKVLAAGERAVEAQEFPDLRVLLPFFPAWLLASTTATIPTFYIMMDGTGVPCVKKDTEGVEGKGPDGKAGTREVKVGLVGTYRRLDRHGRPVRDPGCESHIVSAQTASEFGSLLRRHANSRGYGNKMFRVQIVGDGAEWIHNIVKNAFPGKDIIFTNDFYHTCEYLHDFLTLAETDSAAIPKRYKYTKSLLYRYGGATVVRHLKKRYALLAENHEAWKKLAYIDQRAAHMEFGKYRKQGLYIGSGLIESACRTDVAKRCKQAGMHWRFHNAAAMCALTARFRSNLPAA